MANSSYYAKKREESDKKIQAALEARNKRNASSATKNETHDSKMQEALDARSKRIQSSLPDVLSDIQNRLNIEIESYGKAKPAFGSYDATYNGQKERRLGISELRSKVDAYRSYMDEGVADSILASLDQMEKGYDAYLGMSQYESEDAYNAAVAQYKQWYDNWGHYADEVDFGEYSAQGAAIENPTFDDAQYNGVLFGLKWGNEDVGNMVTFSRDNWENIAEVMDEDLNVVGNYLYHYMTEDETNIYNYLLAKEGKDTADSYLSDLDDTLRNRAGKHISENITSIDIPVVEDLFVLGYGATAGVDQWVSGTRQFFTNEEQPTSVTQHANAYIAENLDGFGRYAHQAATTIGNMAPSILLSTVTAGMGAPAAVAQGLGATAMGVSAAGNAYSDALSKGYDKASARTYSTLVGASEGVLQYLLGGIGKLGGISGKFASKIAAIDNSLLRISAKLGVSIGSEIVEEEIQNYLEPAFRSIIFGEDYDAPTIDELIETAIVTALSTGFLEGGGTISGDIQNSRYYKSNYGDYAQEVVAEGLESPKGSLSNDLAAKYQAKLDAGKNLNGHQLGRMVEANEQQFRSEDKANIQSAAESRLTELGETGDVSAIAAALTKQAAGEKLSRAEKQAISNSKYGQRVANELNTKNIQSGDYSSEWAQKLDTNRINVDEYSRLVEAAQLPQETTEVTGAQVVTEAPKAVPPATVAAPKATVPANDKQVTEKSPAAEEPKAKSVTLEDVSKKYGAQAQAMVHTYTEGQDVAKYDAAYQASYDMGKSGVSFDYVKNSQSASYLTDNQKQLAYEAGKAASDTAAKELDAKNRAETNGKTGRKKGAVRGDGVTIADLKQTFNDTQGKAYKYLSTVAEATGIDIVLYRSEANADGEFVDAQGRYSKNEPGTIYIDLNAGISDINDVNELTKYVMLRTFAHEFTHFIENWNPIQYNEFRKVVFDTLTQQGENVNDLIETKQLQNPGMSYDKASREVVAEAMTDILPDANFVQELAENHKNIFQKLLDQLKEFVANLREYFNSINPNRSREANALKEQVGETVKYLDSIVDMFDRVAVEAVENYQQTVATEEVVAATNEVSPVVETDAYGFTISDNVEHGSLEITFDSKPSDAVRDVLKENKFRWHKAKGVWYGYGNRADITNALHAAYEADAAADTETVTKPAESVTKPTQTETKAPEPVAKQAESVTQTASEKLATKLLEGYITEENINRGGKALTSKELYALADEAFGGTQAEGAYNRKDAYDAMELAVNKFLLQQAAKAHRTFNGTAQSAVSAVEFMQDMLELLPTQNVRTQEMEDFQQFSTPPNIAYLAAWAANISSKDMVLEPSAGIGGLAVFAKAWGAEVAVNELSKRRLEVLRAMGFDHLFNENAEQIDNILPDNISPSVVIMNPPFSSTAGRTANNKTSNAEKHIDQALARLRDGGRLVAVLGKSMNDQDYYRYWDKLRQSYNIRANLSIDGSNYKKYGTTWGVQIVVIDKTGPQTGETVTGRFTDLTEVPNVLEGIRNDRSNVEENRSASSNDSIRESVSDGGNRQSDIRDERSGERAVRSASDSQREENRKSSERNEGARNRTDGKTVAETGRQETGSAIGENAGTDGHTNIANSNGTAQSSAVDRSQSEQSLQQLTEQENVSDDGVYATFVSPDIPVKGGKKHPAVLVESAAMAAVSMPKATYKPSLPDHVVKNNLSDAQLVTVTYAGQAHSQNLPDGRRKGFFVGDGTGVGKGRQIAGIILDNFMQGRTKAVWISKNNDLYGDAIRDWTATTGRGKDEVINHSRIKPKDKISLQEGILYSTYDTIKSEKGGNRLEQIVEWLGKDFDGVIAFDEAHNMGNLFGKKGKFGKSKGSEKARAGVELQRMLPNARIVYVSATAATEVDNLAYAERIGLWGQGTAFTTAQDFISKIGASGLAAMELVIRDMKAMGTYVARSISYNGVNYDTVEHSLDPMQTEIYNTMSRAWQKTMSNVQSALETTGGQYNSTERQKALGNFYSAMQRFYNQVLTSMSMPSVVADMRRELAAGHSCVLQIVNTNEAQQNKQLAEAKASGESLDNLDLTPREALIGYLTTSFPTQMFEEYTDDDGNLRSRPVMDSAGNPVQNKAAIRQRDALIEEVNQMSIPDGPLEMLFDAFGPDAVAENTGRSRRVVPRKQADGTISRVEERRTLNHRTADVQAFQDGKKRILVFSDAGGTGKSYHADRTEKNQQLRIHYVLQPGWVASNAVQGFGRTHRSNEASAPIYKLVTTNIKGQKRFTSTIARRLDQLGALTKGQRDTGSGMFGAKDNLETDLAKDSLREFYKRLGKNQIEGIDGMKTLDRLGLKQKFTDEYGSFKLNDNLARDIGTFLNRILALEVDEQNVVFDAFISIYEMELEAAIQSGTLDTGMENVKADRIEVVDDKVIRQDKNTGASTHYIQAKTFTKPKVVTTVAEMEQRRSGFEGIYKTETGAVKAVYRIADKTTEWGAIQKQYRLVGPNQGAKNSVWGETTLKEKAQLIDKADWQKEWDAEVAKVPEFNEDTLHMLTGALLPIWNNLPQEGNTKVKRLLAHDGSTYLGRVIDKDLIDGVLKGFDIGRTMEVFTAQQVMDKALDNGVHFYLTNDRTQIFRSRVSGQWRLEIVQPHNSWYLTRRYPGIIQERISYRDRYFIPVGEKGAAILEKLLADNPVRNTADDSEQFQSRAYLKGRSSYKNISQQEWRQIQEDRMSKYGGRFDEMPIIDFTFAHDILYVFENMDETRFGVLEKIDPAKDQAKTDRVVEVFNNGEVRGISDYRGRLARIRSERKLRSEHYANAQNGRTDGYDAGVDNGSGAGSGSYSNGSRVPGASSGNNTAGGEQSQQHLNGLASQDADFSLSNVVEGTGDLIAMHNITAELLGDALKRNGLLMPSLAITNKGMNDFGEISLLFDKNTIDPNKNSENKLYGADAWTPTQTRLKKNAKFDTDKTIRTVNTMKNRIGLQYVGELFNVTTKQFKDTIVNADGSIYDAYAHNIGVQTAYAKEKGIISKIPTKQSGAVDKVALQEQLNKELDTDNGWRQYKKWLSNISDTIITSYDEASNEEILKNMKAQPASAKTFKLTENGELVVPATEYSTIDEARKNKNRLSENAAEAAKVVADEFLSLAKKIDGNTKTVVDAINAAFANRYSTEDIAKSFNGKGIKISAKTASELQSLYKKAVELPTQYFEAKPQRVVGLDEIKAVVMPKDAPIELRQSLKDMGIKVVEYDGSKESRAEALNSVEEVKFQQRTNTLTDREVLALAASQVKVSDMTAAEKDALDIFQKRLSKLEALQDERAEQGRLYKEQQFGANVDRAAAAETLNRMHILDSQIQKASVEVLGVEEKTVLKRVLQKARTVVEQQERQHGQEILKRWRDRRNNADAIKKYRDRLRGDVDELTNWVLHPDNKNVVKHIPDALKNTVIPFLSSINFESKRSLAGGNPTQADKALMEQTRRLAKVMENTVDIDDMYSNYTDLPPDFMKNLRNFIDTAQGIVDNNSGDFIINQMTAEELKTLSKVVRTLKEYIMKMNRFHVNAMFKHVYDAGENSIDFMAELKPAENTGAVSQFLLWQQMRPAYAFERFGKGGQAVYDGLRRGQATLAFNTKKIVDFSEKAYTTAEVKAWENEVKTIRIGPGKTVKMRVSQIMSLYELNKREQAQGHIFGEGIRVATFKNGKQKISDVGQTLTPGELNMILRELTPRQKEVADNLQQFMQKQGGEWGNYVTVARFGEKQFGEENYFPINSDGRHLSVDADEKPGAAALYALLNMGFTKQTQEKAKNRIVIYSIFDVFSNHMASMAQYNAFALPVVDALKWFNYQRVNIDEDGTKTILGSVREQMDRAFGVPEENRPGSGRRGYAQNFVINIIKALNGTEAQGTTYDSWGLQTLHNYNRAQIAYNFRVVVQQPMAITRAAQLLDYGSIIKGMKLQPAAIQKNIREMQKYSGIAAWKSLGFYDVNISRGLTSIIKHDDTVLDKVTDVGMWGAEKADAMTWAAMWSACKEEVIRKQKLTPKSEGFYEAVTKLFEEVIYKTQVVDSVLTKNEFMRDKGFWARAVGSFMSEPTTTASMLIDAYDKYYMDMQRGMNRQQAWKKNSQMIVRTAYVYGIGAFVLAAVQAAADAFRDDDDYEEWYEKWLEAFGGNLVDELMPFNKLPILSDVYDLAKELLSIFGVDTYGNPPQSVFMQWYDSLVKGTEIIYDKISGEDISYTWYGGAYKLLQAASGMTGLPMAGATREIVTAWNNIVGAMAPSLKVKTYDSGEKNEIKYAYQDGYLTAEEAIEQLQQQGVVDTEDEAYFLVQGWEAGDGYSRYDAIFDAVRNGGDFNAAMGELTSHGYTEKDILGRVKSEIGKWYKGGQITKQQATNMLTKYIAMGSEDAQDTVGEWTFGMEHPELDGRITYTQYKRWETSGKPSGVSLDLFASVADFRNDGTSDGVKSQDEVAAYINSLNISDYQKDALWCCFWKESTLKNAPWH